MSEGPVTEPVGTSEGNGAAPQEEEKKKGMKRSTRISLVVILTIAVLAGGGVTAWYFIDAQNYVTTDNAQVDGDKISINAPTSGTVIDWAATEGSQVQENNVVGRVRMQGGFVQPEMPVRAPADGTVAVNNAVEGTYVTAGTELAVAYDFSRIYVTARVEETDIVDVRPGQLVDISVDAFPGVDLTGTVRDVQGGAAGVFSIFPESNTSGNFQKVTQVIPVTIDIENAEELALVPGMNVTVKIHKS
ncbi:efflux RND transporter periplasmic adaptor subunit [Pseudonocardia kunmingensis]|uniref:CusB/HlyD membrane fusion family barrel-sandwich protein n=1 Tax=Pseudonocardia kunmingensis TaxID=630975 RepID=A0A543E476_9PSEU|nr:efflux RND transporter periplasmic adaptor subunit [Pseudonocardia kunmingensis]TQM16371.1 CusB/HlyD membrane fusion family barrel-sandwich protein [Pseudonocardia kunmingensis]